MAEAPPPIVRFAILGPVDVSGTPGAERLMTQPKLLTLLVYLLLSRHRGYLSRDRVVASFWPEQDVERARASLRTALYSTREILDADLILRRGDDLAVNENAVTCDAWEFTAAVRDGSLAHALELYRGPLCEGIYPGTQPLEQWLDEERERYRVDAADAAWTLAERYESSASDLTSAARWARRAARLARSDERRIRRVMSLLDRAGDTAGAITVFEEFARFIRRELDVEPSAETTTLARKLRLASRG
jgi:DNA-binding SARP family transcriptional activator